MSAAEPSDLSPPRRRWWVWLLLVLFVVASVVALRFVGEARRDRGRLARMVAELDRDDPNWRLADLEAHREEVPDAENSALVIMASARLLPSRWQPQDLDEMFQNVPPQSQLGPVRTQRLREVLQTVEPALQPARCLADMPRGRHALQFRPNPIDTLLSDQQKSREIAQLLRYEADLKAQENKPAEALRACRGIVNVGRSLGDEPFLISQLIRIACVSIGVNAAERVLAQTQPAEADLSALQDLLAKEEAFNDLHAGLRGERAINYQLCEMLSEGKLSLSAAVGEPPSTWERLMAWNTRGKVRAEQPLMLELLTEAIRTSELPPHEQAAAEEAVELRLKSLPHSAALTRLLMPATAKVAQAHRRKIAQVRCMMALVASERYRLAKGTWPAKLEELTPAYLKEVPLDPFDGKPLRLKKVPDGIIVYSVGIDATDDGGLIDKQKISSKGSDIGFQLWDPAHRRQAPVSLPAPSVPPGEPFPGGPGMPPGAGVPGPPAPGP